LEREIGERRKRGRGEERMEKGREGRTGKMEREERKVDKKKGEVV